MYRPNTPVLGVGRAGSAASPLTAGVRAAVADCEDLRDGAVVLIGGFGDAGVPEQLIDAVRDCGLKDLTIVSNNAGSGDYGLARLLASGCAARMVCSFPRSSGSVVFEELYEAPSADEAWRKWQASHRQERRSRADTHSRSLCRRIQRAHTLDACRCGPARRV